MAGFAFDVDVEVNGDVYTIPVFANGVCFASLDEELRFLDQNF